MLRSRHSQPASEVSLHRCRFPASHLQAGSACSSHILLNIEIILSTKCSSVHCSSSATSSSSRKKVFFGRKPFGEGILKNVPRKYLNWFWMCLGAHFSTFRELSTSLQARNTLRLSAVRFFMTAFSACANENLHSLLPITQSQRWRA